MSCPSDLEDKAATQGCFPTRTQPFLSGLYDLVLLRVYVRRSESYLSSEEEMYPSLQDMWHTAPGR